MPRGRHWRLESWKSGSPLCRRWRLAGGILFIGDSAGAAIFAVDTGDRKSSAGGSFEIKGINEKVAALLGTAPDQIEIRDVAVNPISHNVYLSVSRGRGPTLPQSS